MAGAVDTICALASGAPPSAIALIRLSGPSVSDIAKTCLKKGLPPPRQSVLDGVIDADGFVIDEGLAVFMAGPNSYTGEDTLELSLHGGRTVIDLTLERLIECGARLAEPGEFTRRAFEHGKLDLTQAEAIADLIDAESEAQHQLALTQLDGALSDLYANWREAITDILALLEASIDFPDEDDAPQTVTAPVKERLAVLAGELGSALAEGNITERIRDGFRIAILGRPNAGKSTLLNLFAGREAAIVTDIAGTTRDVIDVRTKIGPYLCWISDTAGLRETDDPVEAIGVDRAKKVGAEADLRIWVVDVTDAPLVLPVKPSESDLVVLNKSDLAGTPRNVSRETFSLSAQSGEGLNLLIEEIEARLERRTSKAKQPFLTRARHRFAIERALKALSMAQNQIHLGRGNEFVAEDVRLAAMELATLTGDVDVEAILGAVFSSFCIGK